MIHAMTYEYLQEYFQPKISRKTRIFRLGRKKKTESILFQHLRQNHSCVDRETGIQKIGKKNTTGANNTRMKWGMHFNREFLL